MPQPIAGNGANFQNYSGRYKLEQVRILSGDLSTHADITEMFIEINIHSSVFNQTAVCDITMIDAANLLSEFPIVGGLQVEMLTSHGVGVAPTKRNFIINRVKDITDAEGQRLYTLECISVFHFVSTTAQPISRAYKGIASDIAQSVFTDTYPEDIITRETFGLWERSFGNVQFIANNWKPHEVMNYLASISRATEEMSTFFFFQDNKTNYHFAPIESFGLAYRDNPPFRYSLFKNTNRKVSNGQDMPNTEADMQSIAHIEYFDATDFTMAMKRGKLTGRHYNLDINTGGMNVVGYDYFNDLDRANSDKALLERDALFVRRDYGPGLIKYNNVNQNQFSENSSGVERPAQRFTNGVYDASKIKRSSLWDKGEYGHCVQIQVKGNPSFDIAQVVELDIPAPKPATPTTAALDDYWSGLYYTVAKRDIFTKQDHTIVMECMKPTTRLGPQKRTNQTLRT